MKYSLNELYRVIGISKQGVSQYSKRQKVYEEQVMDLVKKAEQLKEEHPGCGVEKMYQTLRPEFMGRDRFVDLFMNLGFRVRYKKNFKRTTYPLKNDYVNLIKGMEISSPSTVWQSDITFIKVGDRYYYTVFIIDVFTKKIVGHKTSNHMRATANMEALDMALLDNKMPLYHHSDRGGQYIYREYIKRLEQNNCQISMAFSAQDNAYAERINRTIKEEYLQYWKPKTYNELVRCVNKAVKHYNTKRPHNNIQKLTPEEFEHRWEKGTLNQTPVFNIYNNEEHLKIVGS